MGHFPRICISSTAGGGGKTLLSLGLGYALHEAGHAVKPFKKGPDYIDAAWLAGACNAPCTNLDPFFMDDASLRKLFAQSMASYEIALLEGNRGLYDGLNETGSCSTAKVARALDCPLLLCVNCAKTTRTVAALLKGLTAFEQGLNFAGVVLNKVGSSRHESSLRRAIEANTDLSVLGALPRLPLNPLPERHMGLATSGKGLNEDLISILAILGEKVKHHCDVAAILAAARAAPPLPDFALPSPLQPQNAHPVIGVVRDAALWFYYEENLRALELAGATLRDLSLFDGPDNDWNNLDGLYLGGGFPEDYASQISQSPRLANIKAMAIDGRPIYAECGGLLILGDSLEINGKTWPMAGIFPGQARLMSRPQGLGYIEGIIGVANPWYAKGLKLRGHEFHYSRIDYGLENTVFALLLKRGAGVFRKNGQNLDGLVWNNVWGSYTHIFAPAVSQWAEKFISLASRPG